VALDGITSVPLTIWTAGSPSISVAAITRRSGSGTTSNLSRQRNCHQFENLADDFRAVCTAIGISPSTLPQYNRSTRQHYSKYYDDELRDLVRTRFAAEIERFNYTFEEQ
jgi:hypothetical protein